MKKLLLPMFWLSPLFSLAQTPSSDAAAFGTFVLGTLAFLFMVIITRAVFMISTITRNLKLQTELLMLLAGKDADEATLTQIKKIYSTREKTYYNKELISRYK